MLEASLETCAAAESSAARGVRYAAGALLVLFALVECAAASLMVAGHRSASGVLYLLCSLSLVAAAVVAVRQRRALIAVRISAVAAAVMLFWSMSVGSTPSFTFRGQLHDLTPVLAGMLLAAVLLPRLLRQQESEAACNCQ